MKWILFPIFSVLSAATFAAEPPELWSEIKDLDKSKEACEIQSSFILQSIGLENQVENKRGIYGNVKSNRVVVKCIAISSDKSKLMVAVAGNDRKSVEAVRNKLVKSIN